MKIQEIPFGTPAFDENLRLRDDVLRKPLNMEFFPEDIALEWDSTHIGCYTEEGELMGSLVMKSFENGQVKMRQVAVADNFQRRGVGRKMVEASEVWAKNNDFKEIILNAREVAVPFYLSMDYEQVGERFLEVGIPHFKMMKKMNV